MQDISNAIRSDAVDGAVQPAEAEHDTFARTLWGEARDEGVTGMAAVAAVILNRMAASAGHVRRHGRPVGWGGPDAVSICRAPWQFSCWSRGDPNRALIDALASNDASLAPARLVADMALDGRLGDIVRGADHYHAKGVLTPWARGRKPTAAIGRHLFYRLGF